MIIAEYTILLSKAPTLFSEADEQAPLDQNLTLTVDV